jgi:hypothetical protein
MPTHPEKIGDNKIPSKSGNIVKGKGEIVPHQPQPILLRLSLEKACEAKK